MKFARHSLALGLAAVVASMSACGTSGSGGTNPPGGIVTLTVSTGVPAENIFVKDFFEPYLEQIEQESNGSIQFEHYPGGQLGSLKDAMSNVTTGVADMAFVTPGSDPGSQPITAGLISMPGLYPDSETGTKALTEMSLNGPIFTEDYERHGVRPLFTVANIPYELWTTDSPVSHPNDLRGLKLRTTGGAVGEYLQSVGASPTQIDIPETFGALDSGVIDGVIQDSTNLEAFGLSPVVKYANKGLTLGGASFGYVIDQSVYDNLTEEQRNVFDEAGKDITEKYSTHQQDADARLKASESFANITFSDVPERELEAWQRTFDDFTTNYLASRDEKFMAAYEEFTQKINDAE